MTILMTTTDLVQGKEIYEYKGIVSGQAIVGAHIVKDIFASFRDVFGGRSKSYESTIQSAREDAIEDMMQSALSLGGDAIVGVDMEYQAIGKSNSMLMVSVTGTAVKVR